MNNSIYNFLYDSIINTYLINHCGLRPTDGDQYGLVGESDCIRLGTLLLASLERPPQADYGCARQCTPTMTSLVPSRTQPSPNWPCG